MVVTAYRRGVFDTEMLERCEHVRAQVCAEFDAALAESNGEQDQVHLLVQYLPKVALFPLVNSLRGVLWRRLRQDFAGRVNRAGMGGRSWSPSSFAGSCGGPPLTLVQDYTTNQRRTGHARFPP